MSASDTRLQDASVPEIVLYDRRTQPDRREAWRGGRRDSDWINRPPGALERLERLRRRAARLRHFGMSLW